MFFAINELTFSPQRKKGSVHIQLKVIMKFLFRFAIFLLFSLVIATAMAKDAEAPRRKLGRRLPKSPKAPKAPKSSKAPKSTELATANLLFTGGLRRIPN